jgi:hypothetical protein
MSDYFERIEAHLLDAVERRATSTKRRRWRSWWAALAAGGLATAGAVVVLALVLSASTSPPAYAIVVRADGSVALTLNEVIGIGPVNARLARLGVRARVARREPGCTTKAKPIPWLPGIAPLAVSRSHGHDTLQTKRETLRADVARSNIERRLMREMVYPKQTPHGTRMIIQPSAIPVGDTLLLVFSPSNKGEKAPLTSVGGTTGLYADPAPACLPVM